LAFYRKAKATELDFSEYAIFNARIKTALGLDNVELLSPENK